MSQPQPQAEVQKAQPSIQRFDFFNLQDFTKPSVETPQEHEKTVTEITPPAPPPAPTFSESDLEAAKQAAFAEGMEAGKKEAQQEADQSEQDAQQRLTNSINNIAEHMQESQRMMTQQLDEQQQALLAFARSMAQKLALAALRSDAEKVLRDMIEHCLPHIVREPNLHITAAQQDCETLTSIMDEAIEKTGFKGTYIMEASEDMMRGDIKLDWHNGSAERSFQSVMDELDALFVQQKKKPHQDTTKTAKIPADEAQQQPHTIS